jgi:hypothetical protein
MDGGAAGGRTLERHRYEPAIQIPDEAWLSIKIFEKNIYPDIRKKPY